MSKHHTAGHQPDSENQAGGADEKGSPAAQAGAAKSAGMAEAGTPESEKTDKTGTEGSKAAADEAAFFKARIGVLEKEASDLKDQYLRKAAEFENSRKRMAKDKQDAIDFANQSLLLDIIPVIDDFERAIKSADSSGDLASFKEGIAMIEKRLVAQLEAKWGLVRFESAGQAFDPNRHEAIAVDKSAEVSEAVVGEDFVRGYTLKDRVVRSAKVKVIMPADESPAASSGETPAGKN